jgi:hypothetical protein
MSWRNREKITHRRNFHFQIERLDVHSKLCVIKREQFEAGCPLFFSKNGNQEKVSEF